MATGISGFLKQTRGRLVSLPLTALLLCTQLNLFAQRQTLLHPTEDSGLWLNSANPAAMSFHAGRLTAGTEILHAGFVPDRAFDLNEHRLHLSFPYCLPFELALGFDLRSFNTPLYSELEAGMLFSRKILSRLSLGMKLGIESRSFDRSQFNLSDPNDPLLQGVGLRRSSTNFGAGIYWREGAWTAGASVHRLNQPNIAFAARALQPRLLALGMTYNFGLFAPSITWNDDGLQQRLGVNLAARVSNQSALRFGYERFGAVRLEAQFNFHRNAKLSYGVNLPAGEIAAASSGTHELAYEHILSREPEVETPLLSLSTDHMNITHARHKYVAENGAPLEVLKNLPGMSGEYVDPSKRLGDRIVVPLIGSHEQSSQALLYESYRALSRAAAALAHEHPHSMVTMRVAEGEGDAQARFFEKIFRQQWRGNARRLFVNRPKARNEIFLDGFRSGKSLTIAQEPALSHEHLAVSITTRGRRGAVEAWTLDILAPYAKPVKKFSGSGKLPALLVWNWRNENGELPTAGQYRCVLSLTGKSGKRYETIADFEVTTTQREVTVRIGKTPRANLQQSARFETNVQEYAF